MFENNAQSLKISSYAEKRDDPKCSHCNLDVSVCDNVMVERGNFTNIKSSAEQIIETRVSGTIQKHDRKQSDLAGPS